MPLVRVEVRNEYGLGAPELHSDANKEDPKAVLEGVAVAGLVGILRQLGDLAEFAAEVFHGLQEEVMITSSRSHKLMGRVQRIEAALPPLEKLVLAQRSHLHFAYTAGANWHSRLRREQSHFIYTDLPRFIMDSYEHCRGPPHLNLLDKFDPGGPGSCLKRYSDPSFFRRASSGSDEAYVDKILKEKKHRKIKKKRSQKTGEVSRGASFSHNSSRLHFHSPKMDAQTSPSQTFTLYGESKSELGEQSVSLGSRYWSGDSDHISHPSYSMHHKEQEYKEAYSSPERMHHEETNSFVFIDGTRSTLSGEKTGPTSFCVTWDGKLEILEPAAMEYDNEEIMGTFSMNFDRGIEESGAVSLISKECDNHENLETLPLTSHVETEDKGTSHFKTAEYDYDDTLESSSMNFDPKTQGRGTSLSIDAKEYDLDQTLDNLSTTFDLETQDRELAGQKHVHLDSEELSMPIFNDIQLGGSESELVGQLSSQLKLENVPMLISGDVLHDEVESETDNYVDALNTIESEYETDVDGPTKQEVRHYSDSDNEAVDGGVDMLITRQSGSHSSNSKTLGNTSSSPDNALQVDPSPMLSETCSGERVTSETVSKSLSLESCGFLQSPQIASKCLDSGSTPDFDTCNIVDELGSSNVNSVMSNISSGSAQQNLGVPVSDKMTSSYLEFQNLSPCKIFDDLGSSNVNSVTSSISSGSAQQNLGVPVRDKTTSSYLELQNPSSEHASVTSVMLWTNGGLLGLQPSKPPDFCMLNASSEVSVKSKDDTVGTSTPQPDIIEKKYKSVDGAAVGNFSTSSQDDSRTGIFMKKASWLFSSADLGVSLQKLSDVGNQSYADNSQQNGTNETNGAVHPVTPDIHSTKASQDNSSNSSRMFELGNRLLVNGFHRKPSLDKDDNLTSTSSPNAGIFELKNSCQNVNKMLSGNKDMLRSGSPFVSPSSSPPLGHMKISFQPINGFEAQLQLKFPDGNVGRESSRDTFPSFQLVPEPTIPLHDDGSDSEDDTFCRSSPYESDCLSDQSDSNSEQWESDASPSGKDHELYDSLRRVSFTEAVPTTWDTGAVVQGEGINNCTQISLSRNSVELSQSGHFFDLPSLDTLQTSMMDRNNYELRSLTESQCPKEPSPLPPPLPPPQWRTVKTLVDLAEDRQVAISENLSYSFDRKFGSTISQQPKPAPLKQELIMEAARPFKSKKLELQKTSWQKGVNRTVCQKEIEEKDDFLHQIRTKSFTLRRTVTEKPTVSTVPPTSVQVTAILKKATEIRQAVGSDGEDDNWSDT